MPKRKTSTSAYDIAQQMFENDEFAVNKKKAKKGEQQRLHEDEKQEEEEALVEVAAAAATTTKKSVPKKLSAAEKVALAAEAVAASAKKSPPLVVVASPATTTTISKSSKKSSSSSTPPALAARKSARKTPPATPASAGRGKGTKPTGLLKPEVERGRKGKTKEDENEAMSENESDRCVVNRIHQDDNGTNAQGYNYESQSDEIICCFEDEEEQEMEFDTAVDMPQSLDPAPPVVQYVRQQPAAAALPPVATRSVGTQPAAITVMKTNSKNRKKPKFGSPVPQGVPARTAVTQAQHRHYYAPGLTVVQESFGREPGDDEAAEEADDDLPLAPACVPDHVVHDVNQTDGQTVPAAVHIPKAYKVETAVMWISILLAIFSLGATLYFGSLENYETEVSTSLAVVVTPNSSKCPPGGYCDNDGRLKECKPYLKILDASSCVLDDDAAVKIRMIDRLLHKYSFEHIRRTTAKDENPYFAREEQGRPLYYLDSVAKALNLQADAALLYAGNLLHPPDQQVFLVSDGFLVGVHPHRAIQGGLYAYAQVFARTVASAFAFVVWSVLVTLFAIYSSWYQQAPVVTVVTTLVGLTVLRQLQVFLWLCRTKYEKEQLVIKYKVLAFTELSQTPGRVAADAVFARVALKAFPTSRAKRDALKAKVWRHILTDADTDDRVEVTKTTTEEGGKTKTFWEWTDTMPPGN